MGAEPWGGRTQSPPRSCSSFQAITPRIFPWCFKASFPIRDLDNQVWIDANGYRVGGGRFDLARDVNRLTISGSIPPVCIRKDGVITLNTNTNRAVTPKDIGINE